MTDLRHKRDTNARPIARTAVLIAAPIATLATVGAVAFGVVTAAPQNHPVAAPVAADLSALTAQRGAEVSRDSDRGDAQPREQQATARALKQARNHMWVTTALNVWNDPGKRAVMVGELEAGARILVTGRTTDDRTEVVYNDKSRWVTSGYLSDQKPIAAAAGLSMAPCPDPSVENGLTDAAVYVYRSVCHAFPQITSYGGWDAHGEHSSGRALDIMTSDVALGNAIADFLRVHAAELHIYDILWRQQIWTPVRASEGWRTFASRGSATANHYDHVHVSVY